MVLFGTFTFPHVLEIQVTEAHEEIETVIPYANVSYRADRADLGRTFKLSGEIRETDTDAVRVKIDEIRALINGVAQTVDLEDGTATFNAILTDPEYSLDVDDWLENTHFSADGKFYVPYTISLLEVVGTWHLDYGELDTAILY
jgi:hypothetical protein